MKRVVLGVAVAGLLSVGGLARGLGAQAANARALQTLEQAVEGHPDDLRAANDYRMAVIQAGAYDRSLAFFERMTGAHPDSANLHLNYGFAYVDKIPTAGSITQVILANNALGEFTRSIELEPSWIGYYTRGNSYLFWPRIFNRTQLGIDDLEAALKVQRAGPKHGYHARVLVALGDGYWKLDETAKALAIWREGLSAFPDNPALKLRLSKQASEMEALFSTVYDANQRVDTSLEDLWSDQ
jgi:tetratricopeptide (TPR) repeat protein